MEIHVKTLKFISLFFVFVLAGASLNAAELKIGVVNAGKVLDHSPQKTQALSRLEKEFLSRSKSLEKNIKPYVQHKKNWSKMVQS